jgi:hypothetical protein
VIALVAMLTAYQSSAHLVLQPSRLLFVLMPKLEQLSQSLEQDLISLWGSTPTSLST